METSVLGHESPLCCRVQIIDLFFAPWQVNIATREYIEQRQKSQMIRKLKHWKTLEAALISPRILRNHFRTVFSHYSGIDQDLLPV